MFSQVSPHEHDIYFSIANFFLGGGEGGGGNFSLLLGDSNSKKIGLFWGTQKIANFHPCPFHK